MRATEILLLRHGQSEGNAAGRFGGHGPTPLTALGRAQAEAVANALQREGGLTAIYASDLVRAVETAAPVCQATGIAMLRTPALRERSVGLFTGLSFAEAQLQYPTEFAGLMSRAGDVCPPEGETHQQCTDRAVALFDEVVERFPHGRTLLVSHALTLFLLLRHVIGIHDEVRTFIQTDNCALHRLKRMPDGFWKVVAINDRAHLAGLDATQSSPRTR